MIHPNKIHETKIKLTELLILKVHDIKILDKGK